MLNVPDTTEELMLTIQLSDKNELIRSTEDHFEPNYEAPWYELEPEGRFTQGVFPHSLDMAATLDQSSWWAYLLLI